MTEAFLHYVWKHQLIDKSGLQTVDGQSIEILKPGDHNSDGGPDFFNAQLKIDGILWAGNIEIHLKSSDWNKHDHEADAAYDNCVLHVVYEHDEAVKTSAGMVLPSLELKNKFPAQLWENYEHLLESTAPLPCYPGILEVDEIIKHSCLDRMASERLERKTREIFSILHFCKSDWEETFYILLARNFGFRINAQPFEMLARSLPLKIIRMNNNRLVLVEALLFGQSGLLDEDRNDEYPVRLKAEYIHLRNKYQLQQIESSSWKLLRLRPGNFPCIRLAQFAQLLHQHPKLFSSVLELQTIEEVHAFMRVAASGYWDDHFLFDRRSEKSLKSMGHHSIDNILVNAIAPALFAWGAWNGSAIHRERALYFLEKLPPEDNIQIRNWASYGMRAESALHSQALLHLGKEYCALKNCLSCNIGSKIINLHDESPAIG